jgi:uncharacterized protein YbaP (TraB family)
MKRRAFMAGALALAAAPAAAQGGRFERGLLWRVSRRGAAPSHVYGTIHVADNRLKDLPGAAREALQAARVLMVEFLPDAYSRGRFFEAATLAEGQTLEQLIGAADFELAAASLRAAGLSREQVNRLKPWAVLLNLRAAAAAEALPLDNQLAALAQARRLPIEQLEGVEEQIFTFDELASEAQLALLHHSLAHQPELEELAQRTVEAYLRGDLAAIWRRREEYKARYPSLAAYQDMMTKRVVHDRSVVMAFRMQRALRHGHAFVAVGALHLYGRRGVLALLEEDGYRASRVA